MPKVCLSEPDCVFNVLGESAEIFVSMTAWVCVEKKAHLNTPIQYLHKSALCSV